MFIQMPPFIEYALYILYFIVKKTILTTATTSTDRSLQHISFRVSVHRFADVRLEPCTAGEVRYGRILPYDHSANTNVPCCHDHEVFLAKSSVVSKSQSNRAEIVPKMAKSLRRL